MAKSMRSKWRKKMKAEKARTAYPRVLQRVEKLSRKLKLCGSGGIGKEPMQEGRGVFFFKYPSVDATKRLVLPPFTTNVHKGQRGQEGNASGNPTNEVHPQAKNPRSPKQRPQPASKLDPYAPAGGGTQARQSTSEVNVEVRYKEAASSMASEFVPSLDQVIGRRAQNASKKGRVALHVPQEDDDDDDVCDAPATTDSVKVGRRLPTAAEKARNGSSKLTTKKRAPAGR